MMRMLCWLLRSHLGTLRRCNLPRGPASFDQMDLKQESLDQVAIRRDDNECICLQDASLPSTGNVSPSAWLCQLPPMKARPSRRAWSENYFQLAWYTIIKILNLRCRVSPCTESTRHPLSLLYRRIYLRLVHPLDWLLLSSLTTLHIDK